MIPTEFKNIIKKHLDKFASKDVVFASKYDASDKSIEECCNYIMSEAKRRAKHATALCLEDKVVFGWAIHFFDEKPVVNEVAGVTVACAAPSKSKKQKDDFDARQLSLFDMPGYHTKF